ncbi:hypothetical protein BGW80DRAFT_193757 [Lactifluus volemus]|nr:hypothetical protein BGW80DRAFT_193757 [Lactifluus volemus]
MDSRLLSSFHGKTRSHTSSLSTVAGDTKPTEIDGSFINNVYTAPPKPALPKQVEAPASAAFEPAPEPVPVEEPAPTAPKLVREPARAEGSAIVPVLEPAPVEEPFAASAPTPQTESAPAESTIPIDAIEPIPATVPEPKPEEAAAQQLDAPSSSAPTATPSVSGVIGHTKSPSMGSASTAAPTVSTTPLRKALPHGTRPELGAYRIVAILDPAEAGEVAQSVG